MSNITYKQKILQERQKRGLAKANISAPTPPKPKTERVPVVYKEPKTLFPCIHRQGHVGDTLCGGCGEGRYTEVYGCKKHRECTVSRTALDRRIRKCSGCSDRQTGAELIEFKTLNNKHSRKTGYIVGRGRTKFKDEDLATLDGPIVFINDAVQLEKHCRPDQDTYFIAQDKRMIELMYGMKSTAVISKGSGLGFQIDHNVNPNIGKICWTINTVEGSRSLLLLTRDQMADDRRLYRAGREILGINESEMKKGPSPTICPAIHFMWYLGVENVKLIRCDGLSEGYDPALENKSNSPIINVGKYTAARRDAIDVMNELMMTYEFIGEPDPLPKEEGSMLISFTSTETDAPGRIAINERALESMKENLLGVDLKECDLYLNIDHVPDGVGHEPLVAVASQYFKNVHVNATGRGDFGGAFKWCLSQPTTNYIMHYELDWVMNSPVSIFQLRKILDEDPKLACVNLRAYPFRFGDPRICLSPGLWKTSAAREISDRIEPGFNPESQLRKKSPENDRGGKQGEYIGRQFPDHVSSTIIQDIGRAYLQTTKYRRSINIKFNSYDTVA